MFRCNARETSVAGVRGIADVDEAAHSQFAARAEAEQLGLHTMRRRVAVRVPQLMFHRNIELAIEVLRATEQTIEPRHAIVVSSRLNQNVVNVWNDR